ncbi:unnamed protein product [marine sediment metagenome]|uniref:Uncharacterized protein n=1 Tax=marine sediment metagenome TaxID=412755 RepID=X1HP56_9ZZZZ
MSELIKNIAVDKNAYQIPVTRVHTLVLGSGASGLNAAAQLYLRLFHLKN